MPVSQKSSSSSSGGETASNNLWVGNLTSEITESDLMELFAKYGALDSVVSYSSRSYAFVYFKHIEDAKVAKDALQGALVRGVSIKIEFARPAKPSKSLWVGGINSSVTKEALEEEFLKYGKIEDFKFFGDRSTALVEYFKMEDASQAMRSMNGKRLGGDQIRVDYLRSQPVKRDQWSDLIDKRDGQLYHRSTGPTDSPWMPQDSGRNYSGSKRQQLTQSLGGRKGEGQPSNVLWVGYPPSVQIDEQMLHRAMILFGEIERIKSFPSRHYSFVEFRSVEEARRAKEGLQGRLFNDPRISIMFSSSELAPGKDSPGLYPGIRGPRPDLFSSELPFRPAQMDMFGHNRLNASHSLPLPPSSMLGSRPFPAKGGLDPVYPVAENDLANTSSVMGPNWRRPSPPAPGLLSPPSTGIRPSMKPMSSAWDVLDASQFQRESKRSRIDGTLPIDDTSYPLTKLDDPAFGLDKSYALGAQLDAGTSSLPRGISGGSGRGCPDNDFVWRGIIAKGGTPVCNARCIPIGKGLEIELSEVINCSARTGLDMLTKHYAEAIGFDVVFFLPDSEEDFASYTEFLRYLGAKNRAGVAKLDDGTTLFLVPPSEFLTKILNVSGPERLYGVVLKLPHVSSSTPVQQQAHQSIVSSQSINSQLVPHSQAEYSVVPQKEEQALHLDYNRLLPVVSKVIPTPVNPQITEASTVHSVSPGYPSGIAASASQGAVTLTPEFIATLASILPANSQAPDSGHLQLPSSTLRPPSAASFMPDKGLLPQGWKQECEASEETSPSLSQHAAYHPNHPLNQLGSQPQLPPQYQTYPVASYAPGQSAQPKLGSNQLEDFASTLPQLAALSSRPSLNFANSTQGVNFPVSKGNQQYQLEGLQNGLTGFGTTVGGETGEFYGLPVLQQSKNLLAQGSFSHPQTALPSGAAKEIPELPNQVQQLQSMVYGAGQGRTEAEADKNQRYQSTLQFAANLLLQIQQQQQQQQQPPQAGQGSGNQL